MLLRTCVLLDLRKIILSYLSIDPSVVFLRSHFFWLWLLHLVFHLSLCKLGKAVGSKWNTEWAGLCIWPGSTRVHQAKEWRWIGVHLAPVERSGPSKFWHPKTQEVRRRQVHLTNILTVLALRLWVSWILHLATKPFKVCTQHQEAESLKISTAIQSLQSG